MYLCKTLQNVGKNTNCVEWVAYVEPVPVPSSVPVIQVQVTPSPSVFNSLAITKADSMLIGGSLTAVFVLYVAFAIIAKAVNSL